MTPTTSHSSSPASALVRQLVEQSGERLWRLQDFGDLSFSAVAQALSRLTRAGVLERLSKGVYYHPRATAFGKSRPNPSAIQKLASHRKKIFPAGVSAANQLGFTTQTSRTTEVATSSHSLPRKLMGESTVIHSRRPEAWSALTEDEAALLDFLRRRGETSELSPHATVERLTNLMSMKGRFERLLAVADSEPPRVRAMLGAIGQQLAKRPKVLATLRKELNPLTRFDFGMLSELTFARDWQAKERK